MSEHVKQLVEALREELQQYGEMLALLEQQPGSPSAPGLPGVLNAFAAVEQQSAAIHAAKRRRRGLELQLAWNLGRPDDDSTLTLLPLMPASYRPLLEALVQENNESLGRIRERALQSHAQLQGAAVFMQGLLRHDDEAPSSAAAAGAANDAQTANA